MPDIVDTSLAESYRLCHEVARRAASNFYWSFWLLDAPRRRALCALYAFARRIDDLGDDDYHAFDPTADRHSVSDSLVADSPTNEGRVDQTTNTQVRLQQLMDWRDALDQAFAGEPTDPLLPALVDAVRRYSIPVEHLMSLIDGVERDLVGSEFTSRDELLTYFHQVASSMGLACLHVWTERPLEVYSAARDCGVAFQWTNVLRDLREDAERGRVYLPAEDLREFGVSRDDVLACRPSDELEQLLRQLIARADEYYARGRATRDVLRGGARRAFDLMFRVYHQLLDDLRPQPLVALQRRVRLSPGRKLWIAATSCVGAPPPLAQASPAVIGTP